MTDLYKQAADLQKQISAKKEEIAALEDDLKTIILQIRRENIPSTEYMMVPARTPIRKVTNLQWFQTNYPGFYASYAHLDHARSVSFCSTMCGGYTEFQRRLRESDPDMFDKYATITMDDVSTQFSADQIGEMEDAGIITRDAPKSWKVQLKPLCMTNHPTRGEIAP